MKRLIFFVVGWLCFANTYAQEDTLTQVEYDTVVINKPPVIVSRRVLSLPSKEKITRQLFGGVSIGMNYFNSLYYTCKDCGRYDDYAKSVQSSQQAMPGISITAYLYKHLSKKFYYDIQAGYSLYTERFSADSVKATNYYHQAGLSASLLYELSSSEKHKLLIGIGGNAHYLLASSGKTLTIYQSNQVMDMNSFRSYNKLLGGVQLSVHWFRQVRKNLFFLLHPEIAFEITSFTSYHEYYLQNRFLYALNLGLVKKF